jgi:hypothetical protein
MAEVILTLVRTGESIHLDPRRIERTLLPADGFTFVTELNATRTGEPTVHYVKESVEEVERRIAAALEEEGHPPAAG